MAWCGRCLRWGVSHPTGTPATVKRADSADPVCDGVGTLMFRYPEFFILTRLFLHGDYQRKATWISGLCQICDSRKDVKQDIR